MVGCCPPISIQLPVLANFIDITIVESLEALKSAAKQFPIASSATITTTRLAEVRSKQKTLAKAPTEILLDDANPEYAEIS